MSPQSLLQPYRVMVVDDSAVIRSIEKRLLEHDPAIQVVAQAENGAVAIEMMQKHNIEVVVLDIEMPVMTGIEAIPGMLKHDRDVMIVMSSTLTGRHAQISLQALALGAREYVLKPSSASDISGSDAFAAELIEKVKVLGAARRQKLRQPLPQSADSPSTVSSPAAVSARTSHHHPMGAVATPWVDTSKPFTPQLHKPSSALNWRAQALAVGSSTGGPNALLTYFKQLPKPVRVPIFLTQHMPALFTKFLADNIQQQCGIEAAEAVHGETVKPERIYVAPGDYHMLVASVRGQNVIQLNQNPPENYCRPAVDPMIDSLVDVYQGQLVAVILTGMGADGLRGCKKLIAAGGRVVAQDQATSVVWGMPGAVAKEGICEAVLPLDEIGGYIGRYVAGH